MTIFSADVLQFTDNGGDPAASAGSAKWYGKTVSGVVHLVGETSTGVVSQIPVLAATPISYNARPTYFTCGNGTQLADPVANTPINVFPAGAATIASLPTGAYLMRGQYLLVSAAAPAAAITSLLFTGSAVLTPFRYNAFVGLTDLSTAFSGTQTFRTAASVETATPITASNANLAHLIWFEGIFTAAGAGSFTPQISFSVAKGANSPVCRAASFIEITSLGAGFTSQGGWT